MLIAVTTPPLGLTPREYEIAMLVMDGMSNHSIGLALNISGATVREHLSQVYRRLGIKNRTALALKLWWELEGKAEARR